MLSHIGLIVTAFLAPLIIWAVFKDRSRLVRDNAAAAANFGFLLTIAYFALGILSAITLGIAALLYIPLAIVPIIFGILGAIKANNGELYPYPFNVKWLK